MGQPSVHYIPIVEPDDARCAGLARRIVFPPSNPAKADEFFPVLGSISIPRSDTVDVSFLYSFARAPSSGCERHVRTEEMFIPLDGDLCMPLAPCSDPTESGSRPTADQFIGVVVRHGEALVISPNVWHYGGWPMDAETGVRYLMVLSGHRRSPSGGDALDHVVTTLAGNAQILPKRGATA